MKKKVNKTNNKVDALFKSAQTCLNKKQYQKAYELLKEAAPSGDVFVLSLLKRTYLYHIAPELEKKAKKDRVCEVIKLAEKYIDNERGKKAYTLLSKYEKSKNPQIWYLLALCNDIGYGVKRNAILASRYYLRAAVYGVPAAQYKLGLAYYDGDLKMVKDEPEGLRWLLTAADQGFPTFAILAHAHSGPNINISEETANLKELYKRQLKAIARKKADDYYALALCYFYGYGTKSNLTKAYQYFVLAAKQNHPIALAHMSEYYHKKKDYKKAYECAKKSSEEGCLFGTVLLGDCYFNGCYVKRDYDQALAYYKLALDEGSEHARGRLDQHRMF